MKILSTLLVITGTLLVIACNSPIKQLPSNAFLVDVRTSDEFSEGSVPNAVNIPLDQVEQSLDQFQNKENIVVFCRSGNRSGQAMEILQKNGIDNVVNGGSWENVAKLLAE